MSAFTSVRLRCNWPGCNGLIETFDSKVTEARKSAARNGWRAVSGLDLCGSRDQAESCTDDYTLSLLQGHAAREDHGPVTKPGRKDFVKLSCLCGWTVPAELSWDLAGECARSVADLRWGKHVQEAERDVTSPASAPNRGDAR